MTAQIDAAPPTTPSPPEGQESVRRSGRFGLLIGAVASALTFGALSKRVPGSGGPYARDGFGGFPDGWSYSITAWAGAVPVAAPGR